MTLHAPRLTTRTALMLAWTGGLALALFSILGALAVGPSAQGPLQLAADALGPDGPTATLARAILWDVRWPRVLGSFLVGSTLSLSGVLLQAATRNPIADPYLVGTSSGATLAAVLAAPLGLTVGAWVGADPQRILPFLQPAAALIGALLAVSLTFAIARAGGPLRPERVLLAGLVLTAFGGAATSFALYRLSDVRLRAATSWLMGGVSVPSLWALVPGAVVLVVATGFAVAQAPRLNALALGADAAQGVGVDERRLGRSAVWWSSALAAVAVSLAGIIGFVGLLVPHGLRAVLGRDHRALVPAAVLAGGAFLAWMDALARVVVSPAELPVGILTALAGAPVLVALLGLGPKRRHKPAVNAPCAPVVAGFAAGPALDLAAAPSPRPALSCRALTLQHPDTPQPAVSSMDLSWPLGRLVAVVGPNGAGKTTLLRALAGLMPTSSGAIFDDDRVRRGRPDARRIAFLPQQATTEPGIRTKDLVALGRTAHLQGNLALRLWGRLDARDRKAVDGALHRMDLAELRHASIETLSGGQRQRAFLSMVLAQEAPVLLLDEPTASLDLPQADRLLRQLGDLAHRDEALVVLAIHDLRLALAHADEVWVLAEGRLVGHGGARDEQVNAALAHAFGPEVRELLARR